VAAKKKKKKATKKAKPRPITAVAGAQGGFLTGMNAGMAGNG
jgi:hypothetical protein